jgi:precorrin-2 dehydrogenase / sirohydrochlorin ferrochelatase
MDYYPVGLALQRRRCVVVGGGEVGARKVEGLLACGAAVLVVGRGLSPALARLSEAGVIAHADEAYRREHLRGAFVVIAATDDPEVNARVADDARAAGILVNVVDEPEQCDFIVPALLRRGELVIAVSTAGRSPALAQKLRDELAVQVGPEYGKLAGVLGRVRREVLGRGMTSAENKEIFAALVAGDLLAAIRAGDGEGVRRIVREVAGVDIELEA